MTRLNLKYHVKETAHEIPPGEQANQETEQMLE
jgi:hypothetical protein